MPDLGRYAAEVLGAYAVTLVALALLVGASFRRARRLREELDRIEGPRDGH